MRHLPAFTACVLLLLAAGRVSAQNITIQQPQFSNVTVGTTVSVPDRGSILLGGVNTAADARTMTGPFRSGSRLGSARSSTTMSAHVTIHDFQAMDEYLLNQVPAGGSGAASGSRRSTEDAWQMLRARYRHAGSTNRAVTSPRSVTVGTGTHRRLSERPAAASTTSDARADMYYDLGRRSQRAGKLGVARLHFRMAARYGSTEAAAHLEQLAASERPTAAQEK